MDEKKEGVSVKELEDFAKKHRFEVFFCLLFLLACVFGIWGMFFRTGWNILAISVGAVLSVIFPMKIEMFLQKMTHLIFKQDKTIQIVFGVASLVIAIFFPLVIFLLVGMAGGKRLYQQAIDSSQPKL